MVKLFVIGNTGRTCTWSEDTGFRAATLKRSGKATERDFEL